VLIFTFPFHRLLNNSFMYLSRFITMAICFFGANTVKPFDRFCSAKVMNYSEMSKY